MSEGLILLVVLGAFLLIPAAIGIVNNGLHLGTRACIGARRVIRPAHRAPAPPVLSRAADMARVMLALVGVLGALAALACLVL